MSRALVPPDVDLLLAYTHSTRLHTTDIIAFLQMVEETTSKQVLEVSREGFYSPLQPKCSFYRAPGSPCCNLCSQNKVPSRCVCSSQKPVSVIIPLFPMLGRAVTQGGGAPARSGSVLFWLCGVISLLKLLSSQAVSPHTSGCKWIFGDSVSRVLAKRP